MHKNFDCVLTDFITLDPSLLVKQQRLNDYTAWLMSAAQCAKENVTDKDRANEIHMQVQHLFFRYAVSPDLVKQRYVLPLEPLLNKPDPKLAFPPLYENLLADPKGAAIDLRTAYFQEKVIEFLQQCYLNLPAPENIVHVTSMACIIPTPVQRFLESQKWGDVLLSHAYFYGCHAAIPSLRMAMGSLLSADYLNQTKKTVDLIHTELLSIHMDALDLSPGNIVAATLFSDGFAKYSMHLIPKDKQISLQGLKIIHMKERLMMDTADAMRWEPSTHQFQLFLSKEIPAVIERNIAGFVSELCAEMGMDFNSIKQNLIFALHPGGSKVLDAIEQALNLSDEQMALSRMQFSKSGNLSSATLPYIWKDIIENDAIKPGAQILSLAFGPGMSVAGALLQKT